MSIERKSIGRKFIDRIFYEIYISSIISISHIARILINFLSFIYRLTINQQKRFRNVSNVFS